MHKLLLMLLPLIVGIVFYFRFFFKRILKTFGVDTSKRKIKIITWLLAICFGFLAVDMFHISAIIVLHIFVIDAIFTLINLIVKKSAKNRYENGCHIWKKLYGLGMFPIVFTAVLLVIGYINMHNIVRTDYTVYTEKDVGDGYRVVLIGDVHYGVSINDDELKETCDEISKLNADMLILCGDIVDNNTSREQMESVFEIFGKTKTKHGVFYVYGNHDRPYRHGGTFSAKELEEAIKQSGITILQDDVVNIDDKLTLVGREDRGYIVGETGRKSIDELLEGVDSKRYILTLDHQPMEYAENGRAGSDLVLSGHTHGGQIWPANYFFELLNLNDGVYGHIQIDEDTDAIVTSGFAGWSYPIKTASPAEYVVIDIKGKE